MANRGIKALVAWIWDWLIEHWPALSVAGVLSGMTYLAAISQWLNAYGPVAWGFAGLLGALITALIYWVYAFAAQKIAVSAFVAQVSKPADNINPLEDAFHKRRIKIQDLVDPFRREDQGQNVHRL